MDSQCVHVAQLHPWYTFGHCAVAAKFSSGGQRLASNCHGDPAVVLHDDDGTLYQFPPARRALITSDPTLCTSPRPVSRRIALIEYCASLRTDASDR